MTVDLPLPFARRAIGWLNLRPEEVERTLLMLLFNIVVFVGGVWLETTTDALFIDTFGAQSLPFVYVSIALFGTAIGLAYSWLQRLVPLRWVMLLVSLAISLPLLLFWWGLAFRGTIWFRTSVFAAKLWTEAIYTISYVNGDIAANQLFNIREIKRTFPIVSSGVMIAEALSGFSTPLMLRSLGLRNVVLAAWIALLTSTALLFYISLRYRQAFPHTTYSYAEDGELALPKIQGRLKQYVGLLFGFFMVAQVLLWIVETQYYTQLELNLPSEEAIASFQGLYRGVLGSSRLVLQLFGSSRIVERLGIFVTVMVPPTFSLVFGVLAALAPFGLFAGFVLLRGFDDLFRYTIVANTSPILFQAVPEQWRSRVQSFVRGIADPTATGLAGVLLLVLTEGLRAQGVPVPVAARIFAGLCAVLAALWLGTIWLLRKGYIELLVQGMERRQLGQAGFGSREVCQAVSDAFLRAETDADRRVLVELLAHLEPRAASEVLAPMVERMSPELQERALISMLAHPDARYLEPIRRLMQRPDLPPSVRALVLRYVFLADPQADVNSLRQYIQGPCDPQIRSTAVAMVLRLGNPLQVAEATNTLRQMLTSAEETDRILGCRALAEAAYMQSLRFYVPKLLQDPSIQVRQELLKAIAATRAEEYFPSLLRGLRYRSTRAAATQALIALGDDAIEPLLGVAEDPRELEVHRLRAWQILGAIADTSATYNAATALAARLPQHWNRHRRAIAKALVKIPGDVGIEITLERMGRAGIETLVRQELCVMGMVLAAHQDCGPAVSTEAALLQRALELEYNDGFDRLFLLMKFLYEPLAIQAAAFHILAGTGNAIARGVEILDNAIDLPTKHLILGIADKKQPGDRLRVLEELMPYEPQSPLTRLQDLVESRHCLMDWTLACSFHVARQQRWSLPAAVILQCLEHPAGFVREAVIAYLRVISPRVLRRLLPRLQQDRDRLVRAQAGMLTAYFATNNHAHQH